VKHIVMGTAGHVDHGKTALIKRLTGIDTDRLKEEKERGITIELGFASLTLPGGSTIGVVDVPGHERFIRNMVAGASGIDLVILVIASDEGVMPQTREHLHICELLGIRRGIIVLTKIDKVDEDWLELVREDVQSILEGTFLADAPIVPVSSVTGVGLQQLLIAISKAAAEVQESADNGIFRLPIDRVFTIKGFGTIVTGTLFSGKVSLGEEVEIFPACLRAKIRGIQVHNKAVEMAEAGQRTAINLQGMNRELIARGDVLANYGALEASNRLDCIYRHLPGNSRKMKNRTLVRLHTGTSEVMARIILLDREEQGPKEESCVQFILENSLAVMVGDRFVIRSYSPAMTIGGGVIVDTLPEKHKRFSVDVLRDFQILKGGSNEEKVETILARAGINGINEKKLVVRTGISCCEMRRQLEKMFSSKKAILVDKDEVRVCAYQIFENIREKIVHCVKIYHEQNPFREGLSKEEMRKTLERENGVGQKIFSIAVQDLESCNEIVVEKDMIRLPGHRVNLHGEMEQLRKDISTIYCNGGLTPPTMQELQEQFSSEQKKDISNLIQIMIREGGLIRVSTDLNFSRNTIEKLSEEYSHLLLKKGKVTVADFKEMTGLSRKHSIPLMEYFDLIKLTLWVGDYRIMRNKKEIN